MEHIYIPINSINDFACYVILDKDTIRAYDDMPRYNSTINYTDFYINSHYLTKEGVVQFYNYSTLPTCINTNKITNDFYYRNDFDSILIILIILFFFIIIIPLKLFTRLFKRFI